MLAARSGRHVPGVCGGLRSGAFAPQSRKPNACGGASGGACGGACEVLAVALRALAFPRSLTK
eukprot:10334896-Alexandrium_andersonii.AAC.1